MILWGGFNFNFDSKGSVIISNVEQVYAADPLPTGTGFVVKEGFKNIFRMSGKDWWQTVSGVAKSTADIGAGIAAGPYSAAIIAFLSAILFLFNGILVIVAALLDFSIQISISGFNSFVSASDITASWVIIRDVINISFIFILLYIAITTIIGGAGIKTKVLIKDVIVGALLINFSLFFTRILIDGGNILAAALYNKVSSLSAGLGIWGTSGAIMNALSLQSLINFDLIKATGQANTIFALFMSVIIIGLAIWSFLYGAILFLLRNIMLLFLMAISPIGFIGGTLPWFKDKASDWWSALVQQIAVAPFYLFMIFILVKMAMGIQVSNKLLETKNFWSGITAFFGGSSALDFTMFINAFLIMGMLLVGTKTTKILAGKMGGIAEKIVGTAVTAAVSAVTAGAGALAARGATLATRGAAIAARGATAQLSGGGAAAARATRLGLNTLRTGQRMQTVGNLLSGQTFNRAAAQPNALGTALTNAKKTFFDTTKKQTSLDLEAAFKNNKKTEEEYEKRYGEIANEIGGKKEREELEILKKISTNIESQALNRHEKDNKADWERARAITDPMLKKTELARLKAEAKTKMEPIIAKEMGVDLGKHEKRKDDLKVTIEDKTIQKNKYAASIPNKKIANLIRSEPTYKVKDDVSKTLKKLFKDAGIDLPDKEKPTKPVPAPAE